VLLLAPFGPCLPQAPGGARLCAERLSEGSERLRSSALAPGNTSYNLPSCAPVTSGNGADWRSLPSTGHSKLQIPSEGQRTAQVIEPLVTSYSR
jgi:hypothetical protein